MCAVWLMRLVLRPFVDHELRRYRFGSRSPHHRGHASLLRYVLSQTDDGFPMNVSQYVCFGITPQCQQIPICQPEIVFP